MAGVVVDLDVVHVSGIFDAIDLPDSLAPGEDVGIGRDLVDIAFEINNIHLVETDQSDKHSDITQSKAVAGQELAAVGQQVLQLVEVGVQVVNGHVVGFLGLGETSLVHTVVNAFVGPVIDGLLGVTQTFRVEVDFVLGPLVELLVEHHDELG